MNKNLLFLIFIAFFVQNMASAQEGQPCPTNPLPPGTTACQTACVYCDFNGYMSNNDFPPSGGNSGCPGIALHNDAWYGFIAGTTSITIDIVVSNCQNGDGLQAAFWDNCSDSEALACNGGCGGCGNVPVTLSYSDFTPGETYWLMIDGWVADICDYTIVVTDGSVSPPAPDPVAPITGPTMVCPGATVVYTVPEAFGAGYYQWSSPAGSSINGGSNNQIVYAPDGAEVTITFGNFGGQVCVQTGNSCYPSTPPQCITVTNMPIAPTVKDQIVICYEDAPYTWDEEPFPFLSSPGTFNLSSTPYESYLGCDSVVKQKVIIKNPLITTLPNQYICEGTCFEFAGNFYCDPGQHSVAIESFQGCDSTVNFAISILSPNAEIGGNMPITCASGGVALQALNYNPGSSFLWTNSNWNVLGGGPTINVTQTGTYHLVVTVNGGGVSCKDTAEVVVTGNTTAPGATATGSNINCISTTATLNGTSPTGGVNFVWTGPGITPANQNQQNPVVNQQGVYTLTVTNPTNGCTSTSSVTVVGDLTPPSVTALGGVITCFQNNVTLDGTTSAPTPTWNWAGPGITPANQGLEDPNVTMSGTYSVTVVNTVNGCTNTATTTVTVDTAIPTVSAGADQTLTCLLTNTMLQGSGNTGMAPMDVLWTGPNNFVDSVLTPTVNTGGQYILTITNLQNGCVKSDTVDIAVNQVLPLATAGADSTITCDQPDVTLIGTGSSTGANFTALWSGPGINAGNQNQYTPIVNVDGNYTLLITNTTNGCTATDAVVVNLNTTAPTADAGIDQVITCTNQNGVTLSGNGTPAGITYHWSGPGIGANNEDLQSPTVTQQGTYTLQVTNPVNGCISTDEVIVVRDSDVPDAEGGADLVLNCSVLSVDFNGSGSSAGPDITYLWTGPGISGGNSTIQSPTGITMPGTYNLTVTNTTNNCVNTDVVVVTQNITPPIASSGPDVILNCYNNAIDTLHGAGSSSGAIYTYLWSGPGITPANQNLKNPVVDNQPGLYSITVTNTNNTCTAVDMVSVFTDLTAPTANAGADQIVDCVTLTTTIGGASSSGANFSYNWTGPGITPANATLATPTVSQPGTYTIVVTDAVNGCTETDDIVISTNAIFPTASAGIDGLLTCAQVNVLLDGSASSSGPVFNVLWTGPGITPANQSQVMPTVTVPGTYIIAITNTTNSCITNDTVVIDQNILVPAASAGTDQNLDCQDITSILDGSLSGASPTITYLWTGPGIIAGNATMQNQTVSQPGTYNLLVTDTDNGCTATDNVVVTQDIVAPSADAGPDGLITCAALAQTIDGTGSSSGALFDYVWQGPGINTGNFDQQSPMVSDSGTYLVIVTNLQNHCTATDIVYVDMDKEPPVTVAGADQTLTCIITTVQLDGTMSQAGPNISFLWSGPGLLPGQATSATPMVDAPGSYNLTVTNSLNGCSNTDLVTVIENVDAPSATAGSNLVINCANSATGVIIESTGSSTGPEFTYLWSGPGITPANETLANPTVLSPGQYTLVVTSTINGCTDSDDMTVDLNLTAPIPDAGPDQIINCVVLNVILDATGSTAPGGALDFSWAGPGIGPGGETSPTPAVAVEGTYTVTVVNSLTGCIATDEVVVTLDNAVPVATVMTDVITCADPIGNLSVSSSLTGSTYLWEGLGINNSNRTLAALTVTQAGTYMVTITAPNGCTAFETVIMDIDNDVPSGIAEGAVLNCFNGSMAEVTGEVVSPAGTNASWSGPGIGTVNSDVAMVTQPGTYTYTMITSAGCKQTIQVVVQQNIVVPTITAMPTDELDCSTPEVGINAGGTSVGTQFEYEWTTLNGNIVSGATTLNPIVDQAGDYQLFVMNTINGCMDSVLVPVIVDPAVPTGFDLRVKDIVCFGDTDGSIDINGVFGGTQPFNFTLTSSSGTSNNQYTGLSAGIYTLALLDGNGCELDTTIMIGEPGQLMIELVPEITIELGEQATVSLEITHTTPLQSVVWNYAPGCDTTIFAPGQFCEEFTYTPLSSYRHTVTVIDNNGCIERGEVFVIVDKPRNIYVPNIFSPSSTDIDNSGVRIYMGSDVAKVQQWMIFDRWGDQIFVAKDMLPPSGDASQAWDGMVRGDKGQVGVYVWYAVVEFIDGEIIEYKGDVTLIR